MTSRGFIKLPIIIMVTLGLGFAASVFLNITQSQHAAQNEKLLQGEITDLRYQVNQNTQASPTPLPSNSPSPSPVAVSSPAPTTVPSPSPAVAGTALITLSEYGVHLSVADPVTDLTYGLVPSGAFQVAALTTRSLISKYSGCKPTSANNALGLIVQKKPSESVSALDIPIKTIGTYKYYYLKPTGYCATDQAGRDTLAAARAAVQNSVLPTLSN